MAAITLAWRGIVPLHASTVALHGKAWLIAGNSGAGKSTLTAELLKAGAELLADDLTPLSPTSEPLVWRGRPGMRLHPATCDGLAIDGEPIPTEDGRGKMLVRPSARAADKGWPVGGILLLGETGNDGISAMHKALAYGSILFRPKIVSALPGRAMIREGLLGLTRTVPMSVVPTLRNFDAAARTRRLDQVLATIDRLAANGLSSRP